MPNKKETKEIIAHLDWVKRQVEKIENDKVLKVATLPN